MITAEEFLYETTEEEVFSIIHEFKERYNQLMKEENKEKLPTLLDKDLICIAKQMITEIHSRWWLKMTVARSTINIEINEEEFKECNQYEKGMTKEELKEKMTDFVIECMNQRIEAIIKGEEEIDATITEERREVKTK